MGDEFKRVPKWEVGKSYKARNGERLTVLRTDLTGLHPICCITDRKIIIALSLNGRFLDDSCPHKWDLIR